WSFKQTPTGFIPAQDKGFLLVNVQLPDAASVERTRDAMRRIEEIAKVTPGIKHTVAISGQSILMNANAPNFGAMYLMLDPFHERTGREQSGPALAASLEKRLQDAIGEGLVNVFEPPPVDGLGTAGGFKIMIEDRGDVGADALQTAADNIVAAGNDPDSDGRVRGMFTSFRANTPWLYLDIDREQAKRMGV